MSSILTARQVFEQYAPVAKRVAAAISAPLASLNLGEDLEAAALAALWRAALSHAAAPRPGSSLEGYVVLTVRGACLDELTAQDWLPRRIRKTRGAGYVRLPIDGLARPDCVTELSVPPTAEVMLAKKELLERIHPVILTLRKRDRLIVEKFLQGLTWVEIARDLQISQARVSQIWSRLMGKIRGELGVGPARAGALPEWRALKKKTTEQR